MANLYHFRTHLMTGANHVEESLTKKLGKSLLGQNLGEAGSTIIFLLFVNFSEVRRLGWLDHDHHCSPANRVLTLSGPVDQVHCLAGSVSLQEKVLILGTPSLFWVCSRLTFGSLIVSSIPRSHPVPHQWYSASFLQPCVQGQK